MLPQNRILAILSLIFFSVSVSVTQSAEKGNYVAEFLNHGVGARALGMGSVFVSIADDATAAYWNPAGLTQVGKHAFSMMYSDTFGSGQGAFLRKGLVQYSFVNYIQQVVDIGVLGVSWIRLGIDQIPREQHRIISPPRRVIVVEKPQSTLATVYKNDVHATVLVHVHFRKFSQKKKNQ